MNMWNMLHVIFQKLLLQFWTFLKALSARRANYANRASCAATFSESEMFSCIPLNGWRFQTGAAQWTHSHSPAGNMQNDLDTIAFIVFDMLAS